MLSEPAARSEAFVGFFSPIMCFYRWEAGKGRALKVPYVGTREHRGRFCT